MRPVFQLQNWSKPLLPRTTTITGRVYRGERRTKARFSPSGAAALQRDTGRGGGEGWEKKRGIRNRRFLCLPRNALFVAPGWEAKGDGRRVCLIFRTQTRVVTRDATRAMLEIPVTMVFAPGCFAVEHSRRSCTAFTRCQKACEG